MGDREASKFELRTARHGVVRWDSYWPLWRDALAHKMTVGLESSSEIVAALAAASLCAAGGDSFEQPEDAARLAEETLGLSPPLRLGLRHPQERA